MYEKEISQQRRAYLRSQKRTKWAVYTWRVLLFAALILLWEGAAQLGWIDAFIMSSPSRIAGTIGNLAQQGQLFYHIGISCLETVIGFLSGTLLGSAIAVLLWWSGFLCRILEPYLVVLNALPKTALGPIFIVWIGAGPSSIIAMTLAISLVVTILEVLNGFLATDPAKCKLLTTLGASRAQILLKVVLPSNYATIVNSLKVNVGLSWVGVIVGEFLVSKGGLGYLIVYGSQVFKMDLVMASVVILAAAAALMYQGVLLFEKKLLRGQRGAGS